MPKKNTTVRSNFARRINLYYLILIVILLICFGITSYALMRMNISSNSLQTMNNTGSLISELLNDNISSSADKLSVVIQNPNLDDYIISLNTSDKPSSSEHKDEIVSLLNDITQQNDDIISAWVISEQKGYLTGNNGEILSPEEYMLEESLWYQNYIAGRNHKSSYICPGISKSLFSPSENVVTIIIPVAKEGNVFAFCGMELREEAVFSVLSKYTFNTGSYPIVAVNSKMIYTPSGSGFTSKFSLADKTLLNIISQPFNTSGSVESYVSENDESIFYYLETSNLTGWNVIVLFDSAEINGNIYTTFTQQLIILVCLSVLMFIFGLNILRSESRRIRDIHICTDELAAGNLNYRIPESKSKSETARIAANVNTIAEMIQNKNAIISNFNTTDTLTGLNNRIKLYEYMDDIIRTREEGRSRFAVMFVDIDNFKWLNETLGHNFGDAVLSVFAEELKEHIHPDSTIFRFSGDEFIIIKEFDTDYKEVYEVIEKLHQCFNKPLEILNDKIYIKFSIGVSIYPDDDLTPDMLLRNADMALHRAKESGKDRVAFYTNSHKNQNNYSKAAIAQSLNEALKNNELYLHYQPIVSAENCDIHGFEVLLRWVNPEFGVVPPTEFINVAEESGAIVQIGSWIFESACRTLKQINENLNPDVIMSINVSPVQLRRDNYIEHIKRVIDITQVNPKNIQLEITESTLIDFTDSKDTVINEINELGISLALDDFGTGYSSLNYLKNFPIKCLKIDKSFIDEINNNKRDYAITDSIIDLVHNLGIHTVAEGIETVGQYDFLKDMNCDYIQGFLMSKPLEESDAIEFVEKYDALHRPDKHKLEENEHRLADERKQRDKEKMERSQSSSLTLKEDFIISK
ncbi:MAG: EAL domain-containing protein [Oscillospiraceae bacterium]|nr:EAL domain-containing protein [Oscillospiraceae bacterium]